MLHTEGNTLLNKSISKNCNTLLRRRNMGNCEMCAKLHNPDEPVKVIEDLYSWWYYTDHGERACKWVDSPLQFYSNNNTLSF